MHLNVIRLFNNKLHITMILGILKVKQIDKSALKQQFFSSNLNLSIKVDHNTGESITKIIQRTGTKT